MMKMVSFIAVFVFLFMSIACATTVKNGSASCAMKQSEKSCCCCSDKNGCCDMSSTDMNCCRNMKE